MGLIDHFPGCEVPPAVASDADDNLEIFDIMEKMKYRNFLNRGQGVAAQVQGPRLLDGVFHNLREKQARYAAEEFLDKHLKLADGELLFKMYLAIKKELIDRNTQEEKIEKEQ